MTLDEMLKATNVSDRMPYVDREPTFRVMCNFVRDRAQEVTDPVIIETGCARAMDDWSAGNSTIIFDRLLQDLGHGYLTSVDINPEHVNLARKQLTSGRSVVMCESSLTMLRDFGGPIDLLYLDSFDLELNNQHPSALHHMMELTLAWPHLRRPAMVAIDDNFSGLYRPLAHRYQGSKGAYVRQFFSGIRIEPIVDTQQTVWMVT